MSQAPHHFYLCKFNLQEKTMKISAFLAAATVFAGAVNAADFSAVPAGTYNVDPTHAYICLLYTSPSPRDS